MRHAGIPVWIGWLVVALSLVLARPASGREASTMKIRLTFDGKVVEATLVNNATARDLVSLLPMELTLEDYNSTEKIGYPVRKLSTAEAPAGVDPSVGDVAYYAPWGNLAFFYKDFGYSEGLIRAGPDRLGHRGPARARLADGQDRAGGEVSRRDRDDQRSRQPP
jgi:hypothetical protein